MLLGYTLHRKHNPELPQAACQSSKRNRGAELTCGVPNLSIRGTRCRGAYFASSLFILTSSLSPSVVNTQMQAGSCTICTFGNSPHLNQSAHYLLSVTLLGYLWCKLWAGCSGRGRREAGHTLLPGTEIQAKRKEGHFFVQTKHTATTIGNFTVHAECHEAMVIQAFAANFSKSPNIKGLWSVANVWS